MKKQLVDIKKPGSIETKPTKTSTSLIFPRDLYRSWLKGLYVIGRGKLPQKDMALNALYAEVKRLMEHNQDAVIRIWRAFTSERDKLSLKLLNQGASVFAYAAGFHLINSTRLLGVLERAARDLDRIILQPKRYSCVVACDFGAGTGALSQTFFFHFGKKLRDLKIPTSLHLIDQNTKLLGAAQVFIDDLAFPPQVKTHKFMLQDLLVSHDANWLRIPETLKRSSDDVGQPLYVSFLGYVVNELKRNPKGFHRLFELMEQQSPKDHVVFYFDPADERDARGAMEVRELFHDLGYEAIYPCPRVAHCPMLTEPRDWCYSEFTWVQPTLQNLVNQMLGVSRSVLASSAYIFVSKSVAKDLKSTRRHAEVVVGRPAIKTDNHYRGKNKLFSYNVCTENGLKKSLSAKGEKQLRGSLFVETP